MKLARFIFTNKPLILSAWDDFFCTNFPLIKERERHLKQKDYCEAILDFIVDDIEVTLASDRRSEKSKGQYSLLSHSSAGGLHGKQRVSLGLDILGLVAEYRALRATIIKLWMASTRHLKIEKAEELIRFNEAIDQALADSIQSYSKDKEKPLQQMESLLGAVSDHAYLLDITGKIIYANRAVTERYQLNLRKIIGMDFVDLNYASAIEIEKILQKTIETQQQCSIESVFSCEGKTTYYEYFFMPVLNEIRLTESIAVIARDVTKRKLTEDDSWHSANYDSLTELPNRRMFLDKLSEDIRHYRRLPSSLALMFIDLDGFKLANDDFGHHCGDEILKQTAARIFDCVRESDLVARLGGDEFTVILRDLNDIESATIIAEKILDRLRMPFIVMGNSINISCSIGITYFPDDGVTVDRLLSNADLAMYMAKKSGKNKCHVFNSHI